jgi:hypothetical protein
MISTDFPEDIFSPAKQKQSIYRYKVDTGRNICKDKRILFCGICRNVGHILETNILRLFRTGDMFKDYHIFIYENDSDDNTVEILNKYKSDQLNFISTARQDKDYAAGLTNGKDPWHENRCKVLSDCRNNYLQYAKQFSHFDYLCVLDLDLLGGWSYDGIGHGIFTLNQSDNPCVSSYGILTECTNRASLEEISPEDYMMYDSFAFRPLNGINYDYDAFVLQNFNFIKFQRADDPVEVDSNFGGLAIYKMSDIGDKQYSSTCFKEGCVNPDHVEFHRQFDKKIILDPSMIVSYSHHRYSK